MPTTRVSNRVLDTFEKTNGLVLPNSYRAFVKKHGACEVAQYFRVRAPGTDQPATDLQAFYELLRGVTDVFIETYGAAELVTHMLPFADSVGGDVLAFDLRDPRAREPKVMLFRDEGGDPRVAANGFDEFIRACQTPAFGAILGVRHWRPEKGLRRLES